MNGAFKKLASIGTALCVAALITPVHAQELKLGVVTAVTGTYAFVGAPATNGMKMAFDEMAASGFLGGAKLSVIYEDNASDAKQAVTLINRMGTRDNVLMVIGPISTAEAMATAPVANDLKLPMFTTATSPDVLKPGPWIFKSTETADQYMNPIAAHVAEKLKPASCFMVTIRDNEGYIRQKNVFRDHVAGKGVVVAADETILANESDFTALATKIVNAKSPCLFLSTPPEQGANIVLQARQAGMPANTLLVGNTGMSSDRYVKAGGKAVDGTFLPAEFVPGGVNDMAKRFIENYTKRFGNAPDNWAAVGYSMGLIAGQALKNAGPNPSREAVRAAMASTRNVPVVVGQGSFSVDEQRIPSFGYAVLVIRDGKWVQP